MKNLAGMCAYSLIGLALAGVACAQSPPSVRSSLEAVRTLIARQGVINYTGTTHDSADNRTWSSQFSVEASNVVVDEPGCRVAYHWHTTVNGKVAADQDTGIPFRSAIEISLISMAEDINQGTVQAGHGTWGTSIQPAIWVVHVNRSDGNRNTADFRDQATAKAAAEAMRQAMRLCR